MKMNVTCSTDDHFIQHCATMLCSLLENNKEHDVTIHLLHNNLSKESKKIISDLTSRYKAEVLFYNIDEKKLSKAKIGENHPNLSLATYYRILLPSLVDEDIDKILYLDCDVIVLKDLSPLFNIDLGGYGVAGVMDLIPGSSYHREILNLPLNQQAFCAGVLMINLDFWRRNKSQDSMLDFINRMSGKLLYEDQDVLNHEFRGKWFKLAPKYAKSPLSIVPINSDFKDFDYIEYMKDPCIIHYAGNLKPWFDVWFPERKFYLKYLKILNLQNSQISHASRALKLKTRVACVRYYINRYIHPLVPNFIEIPLIDIYNYIKLIFAIFKPEKFKLIMLHLWIKKYKRL